MTHRILKSFLLVVGLAATSLCGQQVVFVGNSFTFYPGTKGIGRVTDLNNGKGGGVPEIFEVLARAGGHKPEVHMETVGGKNLRFHFLEKDFLLDRAWDVVVLQDYSTGPLINGDDTKSHDAFRLYLLRFKTLFTAKNPDVKIWLYETWGRPDLVMKGRFDSIATMQAGLTKAYSEAARDFGFAGHAPVGSAFLAAVRGGLADDPSTADVEGPLKLWGPDNYHQNQVGTYLSALVFYGSIYAEDPRTLPADNAAAIASGLSPEQSRSLQALAWERLQAIR
ncbi:MAG: PEP-CTERM sorting domain-containing protein [Verrucomicrobiota bacterium]